MDVSDNTVISGSIFTNNKAKRGGAISAAKEGQSGYLPITLKISTSEFKNNVAGNAYNAIYKQAKCKLTTKNVKISPKDGTKVKK